MSDPIRVELDYPTVIVSNFGHMFVDNSYERSLEATLTSLLPVGTVVTLHLVMESTGETRRLCDWKDPDTSNTYRSKCSMVCRSDGTCTREDQHLEAERKFAQKQADEIVTLKLGTD